MPRGAFHFEVKPTKEHLRTLRLLKQLPDRFRAIGAILAYEAARRVKDDVVKYAHGTSMEQTYTEALGLAEVGGVSRSEGFVYAIRVRPRARRVHKVDARRSILYVRLKKHRLVPPKEDVLILARHSPWTQETLPFVPDRSDAVLISRKVTDREAKAVEAQRKAELPAVRKKLEKQGVRQVHKTARLKLPKNIRAVPDVAFDGVRLEFGFGGLPPKPHWRPALKKLRSGGLREIVKQQQIEDIVSDLRYTGWRRWPVRVGTRIPTAEAKTFVLFQKRLHVR